MKNEKNSCVCMCDTYSTNIVGLNHEWQVSSCQSGSRSVSKFDIHALFCSVGYAMFWSTCKSAQPMAVRGLMLARATNRWQWVVCMVILSCSVVGWTEEYGTMKSIPSHLWRGWWNHEWCRRDIIIIEYLL